MFLMLQWTSVLNFLDLMLPHFVGCFDVLRWELFKYIYLDESPVMYDFQFKSFCVFQLRKGFYHILFKWGRKQIRVYLL